MPSRKPAFGDADDANKGGGGDDEADSPTRPTRPANLAPQELVATVLEPITDKSKGIEPGKRVSIQTLSHWKHPWRTAPRLTSPRSIVVCLRAGVDPYNLVARTVEDFLDIQSDRVVAKRRHNRYCAKRDALLERLFEEREKLNAKEAEEEIIGNGPVKLPEKLEEKISTHSNRRAKRGGGGPSGSFTPTAVVGLVERTLARDEAAIQRAKKLAERDVKFVETEEKSFAEKMQRQAEKEAREKQLALDRRMEQKRQQEMEFRRKLEEDRKADEAEKEKIRREKDEAAREYARRQSEATMRDARGLMVEKRREIVAKQNLEAQALREAEAARREARRLALVEKKKRAIEEGDIKKARELAEHRKRREEELARRAEAKASKLARVKELKDKLQKREEGNLAERQKAADEKRRETQRRLEEEKRARERREREAEEHRKQRRAENDRIEEERVQQLKDRLARQAAVEAAMLHAAERRRREKQIEAQLNAEERRERILEMERAQEYEKFVAANRIKQSMERAQTVSIAKRELASLRMKESKQLTQERDEAKRMAEKLAEREARRTQESLARRRRELEESIRPRAASSMSMANGTNTPGATPPKPPARPMSSLA